MCYIDSMKSMYGYRYWHLGRILVVFTNYWVQKKRELIVFKLGFNRPLKRIIYFTVNFTMFNFRFDIHFKRRRT